MAVVVAGVLPGGARCQITPAQASQLRNAVGDRVEALTILGGDYGVAAANFRSTGKFSFGESADATVAVTKLGGSGDIGDPQPLGSLAIGWQPRIQGNMGWLDGTQHLHSDLVEGDITELKTYGIEFGGGARFWVNDRLSFAPTLTGLYGHTSETYTANSAFMRANLEAARQMGLIDWNVDTWTVGHLGQHGRRRHPVGCGAFWPRIALGRLLPLDRLLWRSTGWPPRIASQ